MAKLQITTDQEAAVVAVDTPMESAFSEGTEDTFANPVVDPLQFYDTTGVAPYKPDVKNPFKAVMAATMKVLNIKRTLPVGISTTVALAPLTGGGSAGSLTFVDGLLVSKVDPT
jgi:hypothetical protein